VSPAYAIVLLALASSAAEAAPAARSVPLPRPRPAEAAEAPSVEPAPPSACRLRLTPALAVAPSLPAALGTGECGVEDGVRLEAVVLADNTRVAVTPPAIMRCTFAEAIVQWVRLDLAPAVRAIGAPLASIDNYAAYDCRGRNNIVGAKLSEHGKANALDVRSVKLADGTVLGLTDPHVAKDLREGLRGKTCARFTTVLGPGSDGYHEDHVHVDLAERQRGYRMCQWDVREPDLELAAGSASVPLPRPRPATAVTH
jgi:hypothetical protein